MTIPSIKTSGIAISKTLEPYHLTIVNHMFLLFPKLRELLLSHPSNSRKMAIFQTRKTGCI